MQSRRMLAAITGAAGMLAGGSGSWVAQDYLAQQERQISIEQLAEEVKTEMRQYQEAQRRNAALSSIGEQLQACRAQVEDLTAELVEHRYLLEECRAAH